MQMSKHDLFSKRENFVFGMMLKVDLDPVYFGYRAIWWFDDYFKI